MRNRNSNFQQQAKAYAQSRYDESYGYQVFIECFDDREWEEFLEGLETWKAVKDMIDTIASVHDDRYAASQFADGFVEWAVKLAANR